MKIYEFASAPNCRRVRMYLAEKGIDNIEFVQVDITKGENLTEDYRRRDINGKVPVLELDDGTCIAESVAIQRYFEELYPEPPLFGRDPKEKALVEMWHRRADLNMMMNIGGCFQHGTGFFKDRMKVFPDFGEECGKKALQFFDLLDHHLADNQYLVGDYLSVADLSMLCILDFGKVVQLRPAPEKYPHLARWHGQLSARPSAKA
ncbi:Glutathione S-transferase [Microbulbifer thermotolerans]|uniref:Glutathione S-transferase family protein n=1 Tax=Microbulbifer thermotolerans TaxID=252514 RepID=A0AB35HX61_MICTH|nr:glutathione S-transferase family protein [Microbulbifer thermotolerans]MCX2801869.1 glutathione S-transferase family protein [Microbulbifer thermotolerans]SFC96608.1 Glutathione S-transferase [Microbulbifer thermotolerans]